MSIRWHFNTVRAGDRTRESQVEKFFQSNAVANRSDALIREGIQNSLDAAPDDRIVRVRLTLGKWSEEVTKDVWPRYSAVLEDHIKASSKKLPSPPGGNEQFRYLVFEDFETSGLKGDPEKWKFQEDSPSNPFFNFFRAEGISSKEDGNRGRHGVGKFVFSAASRIRAIFGLTIREDDHRELLMGTATLHYHEVYGDEYMPDGWYGMEDKYNVDNTLPIESDVNFIAQFKSAYRLSRQKEPGLSIIVPWLDESVNATEVTKAVIRGYYYPIMRNLLVVEVVDEQGQLTRINSETIRVISQNVEPDFSKSMEPILDLAALCIDSSNKRIQLLVPPGNTSSKWDKECLPHDQLELMQQRLDSGGVLALRVPIRLRKEGKYLNSEFDVFMQRDLDGSESNIQFIREGILVTEVNPRRTAGIRGLVVIDEGPLADFLGDAENPSHTEWQADRVKKKYSYHQATLNYVIQAIPEIIKLLSHEQKKPDPLPMRDLFYLPEEPHDLTRTKEPRRTRKGGDKSEPPVEFPVPKPKSYLLSKVQGGFVIRRNSKDVPLPAAISLTLAYGRRQGNPFKKYDPADFRLDGKDLKVDKNQVNIIESKDNKLVFEPLGDEFEVRVTGFDPNRDLHIDPRIRKQEVEEVEDGQSV